MFVKNQNQPIVEHTCCTTGSWSISRDAYRYFCISISESRTLVSPNDRGCSVPVRIINLFIRQHCSYNTQLLSKFFDGDRILTQSSHCGVASSNAEEYSTWRYSVDRRNETDCEGSNPSASDRHSRTDFDFRRSLCR